MHIVIFTFPNFHLAVQTGKESPVRRVAAGCMNGLLAMDVNLLQEWASIEHRMQLQHRMRFQHRMRAAQHTYACMHYHTRTCIPTQRTHTYIRTCTSSTNACHSCHSNMWLQYTIRTGRCVHALLDPTRHRIYIRHPLSGRADRFNITFRRLRPFKSEACGSSRLRLVEKLIDGAAGASQHAYAIYRTYVMCTHTRGCTQCAVYHYGMASEAGNEGIRIHSIYSI